MLATVSEKCVRHLGFLACNGGRGEAHLLTECLQLSTHEEGEEGGGRGEVGGWRGGSEGVRGRERGGGSEGV